MITKKRIAEITLRVAEEFEAKTQIAFDDGTEHNAREFSPHELPLLLRWQQ